MDRFGITPGGQAAELVGFLLIGVLLGALYDLFRLWRQVMRSGWVSIFFQDITYFALAAGVVLVLSLPVSHGRIWPVHLLPLAAGAAGYYVTFGRFTRWGMGRIMRLCRLLWRPVEALFEKIKNFAKKVWIFFKNRLHKPHCV